MNQNPGAGAPRPPAPPAAPAAPIAPAAPAAPAAHVEAVVEAVVQDAQAAFNDLRAMTANLALNVGHNYNRLGELENNPVQRRTIRYDTRTFPELVLGGSDKTNASNFNTWEANVKAAIRANGYQWPEVGYGILISLRTGEAGKIARSLRTKLDQNAFINVEALFDDVCKKVVGASYQAKAKAEFHRRVQGPQESLITFAVEFEDLYERAYGEDEQNNIILLNGFIKGIRSPKIMESLLKDPPLTFPDALNSALHAEGIQETLNYNLQRLKTGTPGQYSLHRHAPTNHKRDKPTPMELGNLQKKPFNFRKGGSRQNGGPSRPNQGGPNKKPWIPSKPPYKNKKEPGRPAYSKTTNSTQNSGAKPAKKSGEFKCYKCGRAGHKRSECRSNNRSKNYQANYIQAHLADDEPILEEESFSEIEDYNSDE